MNPKLEYAYASQNYVHIFTCLRTHTRIYKLYIYIYIYMYIYIYLHANQVKKHLTLLLIIAHTNQDKMSVMLLCK